MFKIQNKKNQELKSSWEEESLTDEKKEEVFEDPVAKRQEVKREKKTKTPKRYGWNNFEFFTPLSLSTSICCFKENKTMISTATVTFS